MARKPKQTETLKRAIGYVRVSSVGGRAGPEYHTLEDQRRSIERVCEARGYELVDVLTDENRSGSRASVPSSSARSTGGLSPDSSEPGSNRAGERHVLGV